MGGCCSQDRKELRENRVRSLMTNDIKHLRKMNTYEVTFKRRPLDITVTSSVKAIGGYITQVSSSTSADTHIKPNSKVISVDGRDVENLDIDSIIGYIALAKVPLVLKLISPDGLMEDEFPDSWPDIEIDLYRDSIVAR